jgi:hypothetical protein
LFSLTPFKKIVLTKKTLKIDSAASSGGQGKMLGQDCRFPNFLSFLHVVCDPPMVLRNHPALNISKYLLTPWNRVLLEKLTGL